MCDSSSDDKLKEIPKESFDFVEDNLTKLKKIFPSIFSEKFPDMERLKELLGLDEGYYDGDEEHYKFTWYGKNMALRNSISPTLATLRPVKDESKDWDTTQNIFIEGDNLEVLKVLQKTYHNKIKMIYIDPPYNTGKDFIYNDSTRDSIEEYLEFSDQITNDGFKYSTNTETSGRYHTNWLNMIYPRIKLAHSLLKDDGVIFISIDDNEQANLKKVCDEIFGEDNFIGDLIRKTKSTTNDIKTGFNIQHENCLIYAKYKNNINFEDNSYLKGSKKTFENYKNPDNDPHGVWISDNPSARTGSTFEIINPYTGKIDLPPEKNQWRFSLNTFEKYC